MWELACKRKAGKAGRQDSRELYDRNIYQVSGILPGAALPLLLQAAQFEVAGGELADQRHLQRGQVGAGGAQLGPLRFAGAAQTGEQIQLPTQTRSRLIQLDAVVTGARRRALHIRQVLLGGGRGDAHARQLLGTAAAQQRFGALVAGQAAHKAGRGVIGYFEDADEAKALVSKIGELGKELPSALIVTAEACDFYKQAAEPSEKEMA